MVLERRVQPALRLWDRDPDSAGFHERACVAEGRPRAFDSARDDFPPWPTENAENEAAENDSVQPAEEGP